METDYPKQIVDLKEQIRVLERKTLEHEALKAIYDERFKHGQDFVDQLVARNQALETRNKALENPGGTHYEALSWRRKIVFIFRKIKRPLRSREIDQELKIMSTIVQDGKDLSNGHLSVVLRNAVKTGKLHLEKVNGERGAYYALPAWLDEEGKLKEKMRQQLL